MTSSPALTCPRCKRALDASSWHDATSGECQWCLSGFEFVPFPALNARREAVKPVAVSASDHATCFYHAENQADSVCESCGRFICSICSIPFGSRKLCPNCISSAKNTDQQMVKGRTLFGGIAIALAFLPLLIFPFTLVTAPAALVVSIVGWNKPGSLVTPGRGRLIVAGLFSLLQIAAWVLFIGASVSSAVRGAK